MERLLPWSKSRARRLCISILFELAFVVYKQLMWAYMAQAQEEEQDRTYCFCDSTPNNNYRKALTLEVFDHYVKIDTCIWENIPLCIGHAIHPVQKDCQINFRLNNI